MSSFQVIELVLLVILLIVVIILSIKINQVSVNYTHSENVAKQLQTTFLENQNVVNDLFDKRLIEMSRTIRESLQIIQQLQSNSQLQTEHRLEATRSMTENSLDKMRETVATQMINLQNLQMANQKSVNGMLDNRLLENSKVNQETLQSFQQLLASTSFQNEQRLEAMRTQIESSLSTLKDTLAQQVSNLQTENSKKLDEMRQTVDEKLQKTLEERISKSFSLVSERLEMVAKGLGEMTNLATGVGDLKRILSNVKTRGILGETQLSSILQQILTEDQYLTNVATRPNSRQVVEFAIKLPGDGGGDVLLPIDSKFPLEDYHRLNEAYENNDVSGIELYTKSLESSIKSFAKDIHTKYIQVPHTTDFAILFLPIEGLYATAVRGGLVDYLQQNYRVTLAGPTTMAALLNSLKMGFQTLAIQKRSSEVWKILASVKNEFATFAKVLSDHQQRLNQANEELDKLVGVRTRRINSTLNKIETLEIDVEDN